MYAGREGCSPVSHIVFVSVNTACLKKTHFYDVPKEE